MSFGPTARCIFCGLLYYVEKLPYHEAICALRPKRLTISEAATKALGLYPEASRDRALLVRIVWEIKDGYRTELPPKRLTDPSLIIIRARSLRGRTAVAESLNAC